MKEQVSIVWTEEKKKKNQQMSIGSEKKLEEQYHTDIAKGLGTSEANRRLAENRLEYLTKEKKRSWLRSIKQECLDPLFFFLVFLAVFLFTVGEKGWVFITGVLFFLLLIKGKQIIKNYRFLQERKKRFLPAVQVLRDGIYKEIAVREIVTGDIVRLKRGQKTPVPVCSLTRPGIIYEKGEIFSEETGKAVAAVSPGLPIVKKRTVFSGFLKEETLPLRVQALLFCRGIIPVEKAKLPDDKANLTMIIDTEYFPSNLKPRFLRRLAKYSKKSDIALVFFTDQEKDFAFDILKQFHISQRDIIDEKQFSCYRTEDYDRQKKTIRAYVGLNEKEKRKVVEAWQTSGDTLLLLPNSGWKFPESSLNRQPEKTGGELIKAGLFPGAGEGRDFYFTGHWSEGMYRLLTISSLWNTFQRRTEKTEKDVLLLLCACNGILLLTAILFGQIETFPWMLALSSGLCSLLALWKEVWWYYLVHEERKKME